MRLLVGVTSGIFRRELTMRAAAPASPEYAATPTRPRSIGRLAKSTNAVFGGRHRDATAIYRLLLV